MTLTKSILLLLSISLTGCGGSDGDSPKDPPAPAATPPVITINIDSTSIDESSTVLISHSAKDYQDSTVTSELTCDLGALDGNNYTAPSVATESIATCTVTATDSGNRKSTKTLSLTINALIPVLALANGDTNSTTAKLTAIDVSFADIPEGLVDATLNGEAIKLALTPDKQLVYFPPMGSTGLQTLELTIEGELVSYEYQAQDSSSTFTNAETYINDFFTRTKNKIDAIIQDKIESNASTNEIESLNAFKDSLNIDNDIFSALSPSELQYFAQIIFENIDYFEGLTAELSLSNKMTRFSPASKSITLDECEYKTTQTLILVGTTTTLVGATVAFASSGFGAPVAVASGVALLGSAALWRNSLGESIECWLVAGKTDILGNITGDKSRQLQMSLPLISSKTKNEESLAFFSNVEKVFTAKTQYSYLLGAENTVTGIISSYNTFSGQLNSLFDLLGRGNIPDYAENLFSKDLNANDFLYKDVNPNNLSISSITDAGVTGTDITNINENNSFELTFNIEDLTVPHISFQFTITDSGHDTPLRTVIDAEVTLNPPIAYSETFAAVIGEELVARLNADFETGFKITKQPKFGTLDTSLDSFSMPGGGLFGYTPDENITEDKTDTFTFVATNGSTTNNGESNEATITVEITANPYTIAVGNKGHTYDPSSLLLITPKQSVVFYNGARKSLGAKLDGESVIVYNTSYNNTDYYYWTYQLPSAEFGPEDIVYGTYTISLNDLSNNRSISVPIELTISNEAYRRIVGTTLTVHGYGFDNASVHFKEDLTYTINGEYKGVYSFNSEITDGYFVCPDGSIIDKVVIGTISTNGSYGGYAALPAYIDINEDGTYNTSAGSGYACPETYTYKSLF